MAQLPSGQVEWVRVATPLLPREGLSSAFGVAQEMISILTEQNVANSIATLGSSEILISPELTCFTGWATCRAR